MISRSLRSIAVLSLLLCSCWTRHELRVRIEGQSPVRVGGVVRIDGVRAGTVSGIELDSKGALVTVVLTDSTLVETKVREGLVAFPDDAGGIQLDASKVGLGSPALPAGAVLSAKPSWMAGIPKFASWATVAAIAVGLLLCFVVFKFFSLFVTMGRAVIGLALGAAIAIVVHPSVVPWVEALYASQGALPLPAPTSGAGGVTAVVDALRSVPRPDPIVVAFVATWIMGWLVAQTVLGFVLSPSRGRPNRL